MYQHILSGNGKKTDINGVGSFFTVTDVLDEGGEHILFANNPNPGPFARMSRADDELARDSGQWGIGFNYFADWLGNGTDLGLYYINYHDKETINIF